MLNVPLAAEPRTLSVLLQKSSCFQLLLDTDISQGGVATHLRCDGIFSDSIITNVLPIPTVKVKA